MMTITEFCERHRACPEGRDWAMANCRDMAHAWETLRPDWLLWVATQPGVLDDRTLRLFEVWCARQVQHLMNDPRSHAALDVAERYAHGQATDAELASAQTAAWYALDAASDAAESSVLSSVRTAAQEAALDAAQAAARAAALAAAPDAAWAAAWEAASDAAESSARAAALAAAPDAAWAAQSAAWAAAWEAASAAAESSARAARAAQADWLRANAKPCFDGGSR